MNNQYLRDALAIVDALSDEEIVKGLREHGFEVRRASSAAAVPVDALPPLPEDRLEELMHKHSLIGVAGDHPNWEARLIAYANDVRGLPDVRDDHARQVVAWLRRNASAEHDPAKRTAFVEAHNAALAIFEKRAAVLADRAQQGEPHDDDIAWEHFASATKAKMAEGREKGRGGWEDPEQCPTERLQLMLLEHLKKGDPVDVANFCMMLWTRGEPVVAVDLKAARQAVLEDAAAICDNFAKRDMHPAECAGAIRMMKDYIK